MGKDRFTGIEQPTYDAELVPAVSPMGPMLGLGATMQSAPKPKPVKQPGSSLAPVPVPLPKPRPAPVALAPLRSSAPAPLYREGMQLNTTVALRGEVTETHESRNVQDDPILGRRVFTTRTVVVREEQPNGRTIIREVREIVCEGAGYDQPGYPGWDLVRT